MNSPREIERNARAYCEMIGADPDELVSGVDVPMGIKEPITVPRWCWYKDANLDQDKPLTGFQRAMMEQQAAREAQLALAQAKQPRQPSATVQVQVPLNVGVYVLQSIPREVFEQLQAGQAG